LVRFLHTADWQIGKPYARVSDPDHRARLRQVRLAVIQRIAAVVQRQQLDFVLVAGDLFDSPSPARSDVAQALSAIGQMSAPVLVIPGNHDHGGPGSLWHQGWFQQLSAEVAPNLQILLEREPVLMAGAVVLPCPLLRQAAVEDPCSWLQQLNTAELPDGPRIVLAHGSVHSFVATDVTEARANQLALELIPDGLGDYIALGDWHGLKQVSARAWYSGCPEQDRFPRSSDYASAQVLVVEVERGATPSVSIEPTGAVQWHHISQRLQGDADLELLERQVQQCLAQRSGEDLLLLELDGQLSLAGAARLEAWLEALSSRLLRLKQRQRLRILPSDEELAPLLDRPGDPLFARVVSSLQQRSLQQDDAEQSRLAVLALRELQLLASQEI
tara:strand:+ start:2295 stop:3455 length:1161 start_codon:yes stop_codon:yes gene_type:complete